EDVDVIAALRIAALGARQREVRPDGDLDPWIRRGDGDAPSRVRESPEHADHQALPSRNPREGLAHRLHHPATPRGEERIAAGCAPAPDRRRQPIVAVDPGPHHADDEPSHDVGRYRSSRVHGTSFDRPRANSTWNSWSVPVRKPAMDPARYSR